MTEATGTRRLAPLAAAAALAAMLFVSRLPPSDAFFLPRRGGFWLYQAAWAMSATGRGRAIFSGVVALALLAAGFVYLRSLWRAASRRILVALGGFVAAALLAADAFRRVLDLVQLVWFPYGSMDVREPLVVFVLAAAFLALAAELSLAWAAGRRGRALRLAFVLAALDLGGAGLARARGVGRPLPDPGPPVVAAYVVLTETPAGPSREPYLLISGLFSSRDVRPELRALAAKPGDARALPALRALYEEDVKRWDVPALRRDLSLGASRGDGLAFALLSSHLASAASSPEARAALDALSDERAYRIGPLGAVSLARAYARLGAGPESGRWAARGGVPAGLLGLDAVGALSPGRVSGTLRGPRPAAVALYRWGDPSYLLDASGLVAAAEPDVRGRFAFYGLPAGRYYLAFAFPAAAASGPPEVSGHRGDITLDARHPAADAGAIRVSFPESKLTPE
ncbi:MAG: hypothetical protein HY552_01245 [Elusimicrobia bacterium]|nr:hypothetical protein [Elusimicrobiota bacterium]